MKSGLKLKHLHVYLDVLIPPVWKQEDILQPQLSTLTAELE